MGSSTSRSNSIGEDAAEAAGVLQKVSGSRKRHHCGTVVSGGRSGKGEGSGGGTGSGSEEDVFCSVFFARIHGVLSFFFAVAY